MKFVFAICVFFCLKGALLVQLSAFDMLATTDGSPLGLVLAIAACFVLFGYALVRTDSFFTTTTRIALFFVPSIVALWSATVLGRTISAWGTATLVLLPAQFLVYPRGRLFLQTWFTSNTNILWVFPIFTILAFHLIGVDELARTTVASTGLLLVLLMECEVYSSFGSGAARSKVALCAASSVLTGTLYVLFPTQISALALCTSISISITACLVAVVTPSGVRVRSSQTPPIAILLGVLFIAAATIPALLLFTGRDVVIKAVMVGNPAILAGSLLFAGLSLLPIGSWLGASMRRLRGNQYVSEG